MKINLVPEPRSIESRLGAFIVLSDDASGSVVVTYDGETTRAAARLLAERLGGCARPAARVSGKAVRLRLAETLDFAAELPSDRRVEAYRLDVTSDGVDLCALTPEGLLRGSATLLQMVQRKADRLVIPCARIEDWPQFRYRGAADWLINVEVNRWVYDWADGPEAFRARIRRKLDFCFDHKINLVWFDGLGWGTKRLPGYTALMRECNRYARQRGIKLEFGGYGGGYGTAYQAGEIYRCGIFGRVHQNRRSYPDGEVYACRGWAGHNEGISRLYGTCLSNTSLCREKLDDLTRFVQAVQPSFIYIHDIDAGFWTQSEETWKNRCPACRKRWPNDALDAEDGQAGAFAEWFRTVRSEVSALPEQGDYSPARDLVLTFVSPLYTGYNETKPTDVWEREMRYYECLSRAIGPAVGVEFGLREQFYAPGGEKKIGMLRKRIDQVGHGHGLHSLTFVGGDNYFNDDLTTAAGALAHFYEGSESVYLSNGGMHQAPVQLLNASFLWNGRVNGFREEPADETATAALLAEVAAGLWKPPELLAPGAAFDQMCVRLWGRVAGRAMSRALQTKCESLGPISHVWWSITQTIGQLRLGDETLPIANVFASRGRATALALKYARRAAAVSDDEEIGWFVRCLEVGERFAAAMDCLFQLRVGEAAAEKRLKTVFVELKRHIRKHFPGPSTDALGGDPGCWLETIAQIEALAKEYAKRSQSGERIGNFQIRWRLSPVRPLAGSLAALTLPTAEEIRNWKQRTFPWAFCDLQKELACLTPAEGFVVFSGRLRFPGRGLGELRVGYDGPVKVWLDGREVFQDLAGINPSKVDKATIPVGDITGTHEVTIALASNGGNACGLFVRLCSKG